MRKYLLVAAFAALGAIARYLSGSIIIFDFPGGFPVNTLLINILGSFMLSLILVTTEDVWKIDIDIKRGIAVGFLGAFTTFSTFCRETVVMLRNHTPAAAGLYVASSILLGLLAAFLGYLIAGRINNRFRETRRTPDERERELK